MRGLTLMEKLTYLMLMPLQKIAVFGLGIYTLLWGLWVANPFWTVFTQAQLYEALSQVAPEWAWGLLACVCGVLILWGAMRMSYESLVWGAQVAWGHWLLVAIFYFLGDWHNTGGLTALAIAIYSAWIALNLKVNHKKTHNMEDMFS